MGFIPGTDGDADRDAQRRQGRQRRRRRVHAVERRLRERRHPGPARPVRLRHRDLAGVQLRRVDEPAGHSRGLEWRRPDALFLPESVNGRRPRSSTGSPPSADIAEPLLEVDYSGRRAGLYPQAAARPAVHHARPGRHDLFPDRPSRGPASRGTAGSSRPDGVGDRVSDRGTAMLDEKPPSGSRTSTSGTRRRSSWPTARPGSCRSRGSRSGRCSAAGRRSRLIRY